MLINIVFFILYIHSIYCNIIITNTTTNTTTTTTTTCTLFNDDGSIRPYRTIVSVDGKYLELFLNWLIYYYDTCKNFQHLDIICLDTRVQQVITIFGLNCNSKSYFLEGMGKFVIKRGELNENNKPFLSESGTLWDWKKKTSSSFRDEKLGSLWTRRIEIITEYIGQGIDVILSDTDAIWLQDPLPDINRNKKDADVIASRAIYPVEQNLKWGSTLCMGFIYLKSGVSFVDQFFQEVGKTILKDDYPDDQKSLNELLDFNNLTWGKRMNFDQNFFDLGNIYWPDTNSSHGIGLLPHDSYLRKCHSETMARGATFKAKQEAKENLNIATIAHCRTAKGQGFAKTHRLKAYKLWKLDVAWKTNLNFYVKSIKNSKKKIRKKGIIDDMMKSLIKKQYH